MTDAPRDLLKPRIYTRAGDQGMTSFTGGLRVKKNDLRIETCGTLDELNSLLGLVISFVPERASFVQLLERIQHDIFTLCAELASPASGNTLPRTTSGHVVELERQIDLLDSRLPGQHSFILPGGTQAGALLHLARCVCRRAERMLVTLSESYSLNPELLRYLNRLSDLLYMMARVANMDSGITEQAPVYKH